MIHLRIKATFSCELQILCMELIFLWPYELLYDSTILKVEGVRFLVLQTTRKGGNKNARKGTGNRGTYRAMLHLNGSILQ